jgi:hypothetical protein
LDLSLEQRLRATATEFRHALEQRGLELLPDLCWPFPKGWCGDAAPLLLQYLTDSGFGEFEYVCGETRDFDPDEMPQSHAWLEQNGLIIDITANQFSEIEEPVMITCDKTWHEQFVELSRYKTGIDVYDAGASNRLREAYNELRRFLKRDQSSAIHPSAPPADRALPGGAHDCG